MINDYANAKTQGSLGETRKVSGFEANVEKVDRALNALSECIETLQYRLNCTLVPSAPVGIDKNPTCQNEPVLSEFEAAMSMFARRICGLTDRIADVTSRCTL